MDQRKEARAGHGEQSHSLRKSVDRAAPLLIEKEQNRGNKRTRMPDPDPPNEIYNGESPRDRNVNSPDADTPVKQIRNGYGQEARSAECQKKPAPPKAWTSMIEDNTRDSVPDRVVG